MQADKRLAIHSKFRGARWAVADGSVDASCDPRAGPSARPATAELRQKTVSFKTLYTSLVFRRLAGQPVQHRPGSSHVGRKRRIEGQGFA